MIPKLIHLIWVGSKRPEKFNYLVDRIRNINSDYIIKEWNDDNLDFPIVNNDLYRLSTNVGAKSDILRFEILYKYGGIYMDYDFFQIKKFDDTLDCDFFVGSHGSCPDQYWNSIIGSIPGNEICQNFLLGLKNVSPIYQGETTRVMNETGPYYLKKIISSKKYDLNFKFFLGEYFFPMPADQRFHINKLNEIELSEYIQQFVDKKTYCIHLHTTSWQ
jgi:mannosyltransferase OCH1-like enzyme